MTEQDWQAAKEEFGDDAFKRLRWRNKLPVDCKNHWRTPAHNRDAESLVYENLSETGGTETELKPLPELFAHDVEVYGDNAYKMYQWKLCEREKWNDAAENKKDVEWTLNCTNYDVRRKTSAALPFDLERATKGDVVEVFILPQNEWETARSMEWVKADGKIIFTFHFHNNMVVSGHDLLSENLNGLRMKYPSRLKAHHHTQRNE